MEILSHKTVNRPQGDFEILVRRDENVARRYRVTVERDGQTVGYCALKPARNDYVSGYRITNYSMFGQMGLGLGQEMIELFQDYIKKPVIPSGIFGAQGQLTSKGREAVIKRLERTHPSWLPQDWRSEIENANMVESTLLEQAIMRVNRHLI